MSQSSCIKLLERSNSDRTPLRASKSTPDLSKETTSEFSIRRKDDNLLSNRDFSTFIRPKARRSTSPTRSPKSPKHRSVSPAPARKALGNSTVESIPCKFVYFD